ncbi:MAG TPA: metallopeptidase [Pyrodictium sp.]|nr:metallopeptidase [Pyrodictium sp.]
MAIQYRVCSGVYEAVKHIVSLLGFKHIYTERVRVVCSQGSRSTATARIWGLPKPFAIAYGVPPCYVIEVLDERFWNLSCEERVAVLVHELLHIPKTFSGGLRPHGKWASKSNIRGLVEKLADFIDVLCKFMEQDKV